MIFELGIGERSLLREFGTSVPCEDVVIDAGEEGYVMGRRCM